MRPRIAVVAVLVALLVNAAPGDLGTSVVRPEGLPKDWEVEPLGWVRVTNYTHVETRSRLTSSGYTLKNEDEGLVCAISRDWWRERVQPGDLVWVAGFAHPCAALDTMALANSKGFPQTRWIDIYIKDPARGLEFGIQKSSAYLLKPRRGHLKRIRTTEAARRLRASLAPASRSPIPPPLEPRARLSLRSAWARAWAGR